MRRITPLKGMPSEDPDEVCTRFRAVFEMLTDHFGSSDW